MKTYLTSLSILLALASSAQYTPLVDENNNWKGQSQGWILQTFYEHLDGQVTHGDYEYELVYSSYVSAEDAGYQVGHIREDETTQRVYAWDGNQDKLLYDFSLEAGDTATVLGVGNDHFITISSTDEVMVGSEMRKRLHFDDNWGPGYWIEGIGSIYGLMDAFLGNVADYHPTLTCFYQNNGIAWDNPEIETECSATLTVKEISAPSFSVGPNPAREEIYLYIHGEVQGKLDVAIYSMTGEMVYSKQVNASSQVRIALPEISSGLYEVTLSSAGKILGRHQVMKMNE